MRAENARIAWRCTAVAAWAAAQASLPSLRLRSGRNGWRRCDCAPPAPRCWRAAIFFTSSLFRLERTGSCSSTASTALDDDARASGDAQRVRCGGDASRLSASSVAQAVLTAANPSRRRRRLPAFAAAALLWHVRCAIWRRGANSARLPARRRRHGRGSGVHGRRAGRGGQAFLWRFLLHQRARRGGVSAWRTVAVTKQRMRCGVAALAAGDARVGRRRGGRTTRET